MMPPDVFVQSYHWNSPLPQTGLHANSHVQLQNPAGYDSNKTLMEFGFLCINAAACVRVSARVCQREWE